MTRSRALLAVVAAALATFVTASLPWFTAPVDRLDGRATLTLSGTGAQPVLGALLLVIGAVVVASLLARGVVARVVAGAGLLAAVAAVVVAAQARLDPVPALERLAADATGVPTLAADPVASAWGWVTVGLAVVLVLACTGLLLARPPAATRSRYERAAPPGSHAGAVDDWDALTRGDDPTGGSDDPPSRTDH